MHVFNNYLPYQKIFWKLVPTFKRESINAFLLKDTDEKEITKLMLQLDNKKVLGPISVPPASILKGNLNISLVSLSYH